MKPFVVNILIFLGLSGVSCSGANPPQPYPNVVFILIDDFGWKDLGAFGSDFYETPNMDRLVSEGMRFTKAYSACPVCSPTRASIMTGKNPARLRFTGHITGIGKHRYPENGAIIPPQDNLFVELKETLIPEALKGFGYATASIGKWHIGNDPKYYPEHQGFDINVGGADNGAPSTYHFPYGRPNLKLNPKLASNQKDSREYLTDRLTDEAIHFIRGNKGNPFFLYMSHYGVHVPLEAPNDSLVEKYKSKLRGTNRRNNPVYAAMIENLDNNVGRLLQVLDELKLRENTIVVLYSDNGGVGNITDNTPLREGKGFLYEGGIRVPLSIRWPNKIKPGTQSDVPVISDDLFPTIMDLVVKKWDPGKYDGISLKPILFGQATKLSRDYLCWYYPHYSPRANTPGYAIRKGDFKLVELYDPKSIELFNLVDDVGEKNNLAKERPEVVAEMRKTFQDWLTRMNPILHTPNPNYKEKP